MPPDLSASPAAPKGTLAYDSVFPERRGSQPGRRYRDWFGPDNYYIELQNNLVQSDTARNRSLLALAKENGLKAVATGNVHYHVRERHRLHDCLVAIRNCKSLEETHRERRANSEFYLRQPSELAALYSSARKR